MYKGEANRAVSSGTWKDVFTLTGWIQLNCNTIKCLIFDLKLVFQYLAKLSIPIPLEFYECFDVNTNI